MSTSGRTIEQEGYQAGTSETTGPFEWTDSTLAGALVRELLADWSTILSERVLRDAADRVVDTVGVALAGTVTAPARAARELALREGSSERALVWGSGCRAEAELAVLANATAAHALDYDDSIHESIMHTGAIVVPVALAVGEEVGSTSHEVLASLVGGYQVADFLGRLAFKRFQPRGFQATSVLGVFAGVAVAGRLRKLAPKCFVDAFGICGSMASGVMEFLKSGGDTKPLQVGWAARSALAAVALAEAGASGPSTVLEGEYGIFRSFAGTRVELGEALRRPFWEDLAICRVGTKFYPVCQAIHAPADAWKELMARMRADGVDPVADLEEIVCTLGSFGARLVAEPRERKLRPTSAHQARFSLPWCLARIALDGELGAESFTEASLADPRASELAARVHHRVLSPGEEGSIIASVEARARSGATYAASVPIAARAVGEGTHERIVDKFVRVTGRVLASSDQERLLAATLALARGGELAALVSALEAEAVGGGEAR